MACLKVASSPAVTFDFTIAGLPPPFAARSGPTPRAPPEAETCALSFSGATVGFSKPIPKPFFLAFLRRVLGFVFLRRLFSRLRRSCQSAGTVGNSGDGRNRHWFGT